LKSIFDYVPCGLGLVLTRKVIARVGLFDTTFHAVDLDYLSRLIACQVNFKYLNIKLYRHTAYPHSGQVVLPSSRRDRPRVLLRHKAWSEMMGYPQFVTEEVLGLSEIPGGRNLMRLVWHAERLRRSRFPFLAILSVIVLVLNQVRENLWKMQNGLKSLANTKKQKADSKTPSLKEPIWDGKLH
jgi:hypothetical protein